MFARSCTHSIFSLRSRSKITACLAQGVILKMGCFRELVGAILQTGAGGAVAIEWLDYTVVAFYEDIIWQLVFTSLRNSKRGKYGTSLAQKSTELFTLYQTSLEVLRTSCTAKPLAGKTDQQQTTKLESKRYSLLRSAELHKYISCFSNAVPFHGCSPEKFDRNQRFAGHNTDPKSRSAVRILAHLTASLFKLYIWKFRQAVFPSKIIKKWTGLGDSFAAGSGASGPYDDNSTCMRGRGGQKPKPLRVIRQSQHFQLQPGAIKPCIVLIGLISMAGNDVRFSSILKACIYKFPFWISVKTGLYNNVFTELVDYTLINSTEPNFAVTDQTSQKICETLAGQLGSHWGPICSPLWIGSTPTGDTTVIDSAGQVLKNQAMTGYMVFPPSQTNQ
ncbi:uncharacterized protein BDR25DRAFT_349650 [Lindgomyces ingoldianus]|uniref:Uncharacterized protein n=1 Tax=Lindgomyces ingoldianus TaxID=673940 RepID=A0ACB6RBF4_9PLEO|nr:uncharacterized protein BDR25DRAFT_349650 [Lindgomyces ingoldianus]KAF2476574.1 hypothetical protein BDR25DRAFT_349650 [Lindgomyces ingoldianus]